MECNDEILVFTNFTSLVLISTMIELLVILVIDIFVENGYDRNYLNSLVKENKHQESTIKTSVNKIVKLPWISFIGSKIR